MFGLFNFGAGVFEANYRCYPVSFIDKLDAENGDKIFLPPSALDRLGGSHIFIARRTTFDGKLGCHLLCG
jgi:ubiquitin fusion degradation protein 1